jgi:ribosomal protein L3 glutamine methyltransferase
VAAGSRKAGGERVVPIARGRRGRGGGGGGDGRLSATDALAQAAREFTTLRDFLRLAVTLFQREQLHFGHGSNSAWDEAVYLCLHALSLPLDRLEPFLDAHLLEAERDALATLLTRRITERVPAAYLTGEAWLGELRFRVDQRVIVPRSYLAEVLREDVSPLGIDDECVGSVLDLCTGSACLAILAALRFPGARVDAVELSADALAVARLNVADYALAERVSLHQGDLWSPIGIRRFDLIISNPPYVDDPLMEALPAEHRHEPVEALAGGRDGLDVVRRIVDRAARHLTPRGVLLMEVGHSRDALEAAYPRTPFTWVETSAPVSSVCALARADLPGATR